MALYFSVIHTGAQIFSCFHPEPYLGLSFNLRCIQPYRFNPYLAQTYGCIDFRMTVCDKGCNLSCKTQRACCSCTMHHLHAAKKNKKNKNKKIKLPESVWCLFYGPLCNFWCSVLFLNRANCFIKNEICRCCFVFSVGSMSCRSISCSVRVWWLSDLSEWG